MTTLRRHLTPLFATILALSLCACKTNTTTTSASTNQAPSNQNGGPGGQPPGGSSAADVSYKGAVEITTKDSQTGQTYASTTSDESALLISTSDEVTQSQIQLLQRRAILMAVTTATSMD